MDPGDGTGGASAIWGRLIFVSILPHALFHPVGSCPTQGFYHMAVEVLGAVPRPAQREGLLGLLRGAVGQLQARLGPLYPLLLLAQTGVILLGCLLLVSVVGCDACGWGSGGWLAELACVCPVPQLCMSRCMHCVLCGR